MLKQDISGFYHSKLSKEEKELAYQRWVNGQIKILVVTGAFGAGIDYGFVRNVFHRGHASSQINYVQETGRAGRDGGRGECVMVYCKDAEDESDWMKDPGRETNLRYIKSGQCRRGMINEETKQKQKDLAEKDLGEKIWTEQTWTQKKAGPKRARLEVLAT
jgi:superfamily II DNA helicase RecQ